MYQEFKRIPEPLQKQILIRLGFGALFLVISVVLVILMRDIYILLPFAGVFVICAASSFSLFRRALLDEYVVVSGECAEVGVTAIRRRTKYIVLHTDVCKLKVVLQGRRKKFQTGATVNLYVSQNTPIYEDGGLHLLYAYLAIEVTAKDDVCS